MPLPEITIDARNGYGGSAFANSRILQVKWIALRKTIDQFDTARFVNSSGFWAHTALVTADPANAADISFGPTPNADTIVLSAGSTYQIPPIYPIINGAWTAFDLGDWYFQCPGAAATIIVLYV